MELENYCLEMERRTMEIIYESTLRCPECGFTEKLAMPTSY